MGLLAGRGGRAAGSAPSSGCSLMLPGALGAALITLVVRVRSLPGVRSAVPGSDHDPLRAAARRAGGLSRRARGLSLLPQDAGDGRRRCAIVLSVDPRGRPVHLRVMRRWTPRRSACSATCAPRGAGRRRGRRCWRCTGATSFDLRRPIQWVGDAMPRVRRAPAAHRRSTSGSRSVKYWNGGGREPVWFVADPLRSDLALVRYDEPAAFVSLAVRVHASSSAARGRTRWTGT